ncbi:MAG: hypothetical protein HXX11_02415 [Desulfuromonadales bacterium]|nr:hypothetical protein [Desulfuromonadales bacterium]
MSSKRLKYSTLQQFSTVTNPLKASVKSSLPMLKTALPFTMDCDPDGPFLPALLRRFHPPQLVILPEI